MNNESVISRHRLPHPLPGRASYAAHIREFTVIYVARHGLWHFFVRFLRCILLRLSLLCVVEHLLGMSITPSYSSYVLPLRCDI